MILRDRTLPERHLDKYFTGYSAALWIQHKGEAQSSGAGVEWPDVSVQAGQWQDEQHQEEKEQDIRVNARVNSDQMCSCHG